MTTQIPRAVNRRLRAPVAAPLIVLAIVSGLSLAARSFQLGQPCQSPCTTANQHTLIFDEAYYVNAARVIAGIHPPRDSHYAHSPLGTDPNAEHPQGAKLIMAAAIEVFGDGPFAWRIGSLIFGSLAILGMYALVRGAGGDRWPAVGAATLMACDNLLLVHGRIGTLDIYALAPMIWGVALYLRGRPWLAAVVLAVADCMKELAPYALIVLALLEIGRLLVARRATSAMATPRVDGGGSWAWRPAVVRLAIAALGSFALFIAGLWIMGLIAAPYADSAAMLITGGPFAHIWHIVTYASGLTSPHGPSGIASYPWQWLADLKPITYLRINPSLPGHGLDGIHPVAAFLGMISPPILALALPAMAFGAYRAGWRRALGPSGDGAVEVQPALLGLAWFLGTWGPYELQSAIDNRTSYLYYMVVVMPGIYIAVTHLVAAGWRQRRIWLRGLIGAWALAVLAAVIVMYPFVAIF